MLVQASPTCRSFRLDTSFLWSWSPGYSTMPFGDYYEDQGPPWVNPFVTAPLLYGAEAIVPPASLGLQARGGIQWGRLGQDIDYTVWADSGPSFESSPGVNVIPEPVIGERLNPLTGTNIATNGKGYGGALQVVSTADRCGSWTPGAGGHDLQWQVAGRALVQFLGSGIRLSRRTVSHSRRVGANLPSNAQSYGSGCVSRLLRA